MQINNVILILSFAIVSIQLVDKWLLAQGHLKKVYILGLLVPTLAICLNLYAIHLHPDQKGLGMFVINSTWGLLMSIKGLFRLKKEQKNA